MAGLQHRLAREHAELVSQGRESVFRSEHGTSYAGFSDWASTVGVRETVADLALVLRFLRQYPANFCDMAVARTEHTGGRQAFPVGKDRTRVRVLAILGRLYEPACASIVFTTPDLPDDGRESTGWYGRAPFIVDGTHCPVAKFGGDFHHSRFWSHKFGAQGVTYQLVFGPFTNTIVQVSGPYPASVDDHSMWGFSRMSEFLDQLDLHCIGDPGYRHSTRVVSTIVSAQSGQAPFHCDSYYTHNTYISQVRWQVEAVFARLKAFKCMSTPW